MGAVEAAVQEMRKDFDDLRLSTQEICTGMAYLVARIEEANFEPEAAKLLVDADKQFSLLKNLRLAYMQKYPGEGHPILDSKALKN